jgi:hypothetical protein
MTLRSTREQLRLATLCALAVALAGCPDNTTTPDAASGGTDAFSEVDAGGGGTPDAFSADDTGPQMDTGGSTDDAAMMAMDDAAATPDAFLAPATWTEAHAQLTAHVSIGSGGHNMAQADAMAAYTDSQLMGSGFSCPTTITKGACAAMRVRAGTMPPGGLAEPMRSEVAAVLEGWVAAGQPAP